MPRRAAAGAPARLVTLFFLGLTAIVAAGVSAAALRRPVVADRAFALLVSAGCVLGAVPAVQVLAGAGPLRARFGTWDFGIDLLSAAFLLVVLGPGLASAWYGHRALGEDHERPVGAARSLFALELAALALVVTARGVVPFLVAWEVMAVLAYFLVIFESERAEVRRAGLVYLVATHAGTLALIALFAVWAGPTGGLSFDALAARAAVLPAGGALILWLALLGFGLKAGIVPLHFWLPEAHASAPSHVSALMSGVVIKMGIYGLFRVVTLLGTPPAWWGWLVLALGIVSGVLGVLWALAQHDLKRLLAYHSVENIGIILMGLGAGALGISYGIPLVAALGFAGAILHTLNHALFKSLLFLGAGATVHATGTRALDRLGGLARRMPLTWVAFLVGSVAIVGLPPLNGFVSEWLVYQALLGGGTGGGPIRLTLIGVAGLALIGGLALACFAKVCGIVFLGNARSADAEHGHEAPRGLLGPMFGLVAGCVLIGLVPMLAVRPALAVGAAVARVPAAVAGNGVIEALTPIALLSVGLLALLWIGSAALAAVRRGRPITEAETWGCGYALPNARMQYTASSFAAPLLATYGPLGGVHEKRSPGSYHSHAHELVLEGVILPAWEAVRGVLWRLRPIQHGRLWVYLLYIIAVLLLLLLYIGVAGGTAGVSP
ncbi:MAG TPA: proton-conducting transporter membrane subunit [Gemmatimonadales bacterium]|nr:proton-conducting transporter membrane subunit [Gemmatimonadales bacterium]